MGSLETKNKQEMIKRERKKHQAENNKKTRERFNSNIKTKTEKKDELKEKI